jgi:hypothetical protein
METQEMWFVPADADPGITQVHVIPVGGVKLDFVLMFARGLV